jgi:hypothetical protein
MKRFKLLALFTVFALTAFYSCDLIEDLINDEETDPSKTMGKVGNYWDASAQGYSASSLTIKSNDDGNVVATLNFNGVNHTVEGKITDKGIYDYVYSNGDTKKPFTLVKFDAEVGDKWTFKVGNQTVTREVVRKSTTDDTYYGFYLVKTIDVEETIPTGTVVNGSTVQVKKILWKFNHKFGFVAATITKTDNSVVESYSLGTNAAD